MGQARIEAWRVKNWGDWSLAPKRPQPGKGLALLGAKMGATVPRRVAGGWDGDQEGFGQDIAGSLSLSPMGMGRALFQGHRW